MNAVGSAGTNGGCGELHCQIKREPAAGNGLFANRSNIAFAAIYQHISRRPLASVATAALTRVDVGRARHGKPIKNSFRRIKRGERQPQATRESYLVSPWQRFIGICGTARTAIISAQPMPAFAA